MGALIIFTATARCNVKNRPAGIENERIITLTDKNFQQETKGRVVLVDFWASWCAPCRMMAPVLNDVASGLSGDAYVGKLNIDDYQMMAQKYQIRNIPTMILLKDGKEIKRFVGMQSKEYLLQEIKKAK